MNNWIKPELTGKTFYGRKKYKFLVLIKAASFKSNELLLEIYTKKFHTAVSSNHTIVLPVKNKKELQYYADNLDQSKLLTLVAEIISVQESQRSPRFLQLEASDQYDLSNS